MEGLCQNPENGVIGPELKPDLGPSNFNVLVSHDGKQHQVAVPSNSTFGDLKSVFAKQFGLKPETHKLFFRGKEKDDDDNLHIAGVKDNARLILMEASPLESLEKVRTSDISKGGAAVTEVREAVDELADEKSPEKVESSVTSREGAAVAEVREAVDMLVDEQKSPEKVETSVISRGGAAVAEVRAEVDKLADQVKALQAVIDGGTKVDDKNFLYLTEMLMRQLLKLDSIEAEGEGRVQRKMEVRRLQSFVDTLDVLKSRNAGSNDTAPVTTQLVTSEVGCESVSTMPTESSSTSTLPSHDPTPTPMPSTTPNPTPETAMSSTDTPNLLSSPSHLPSSTNVTQDREHFD